MRKFLILGGTALSGSFLISGAAFAADPMCGLNNGQAATGEPIIIGAITGKTGPDDFSASTKSAQAYFDCVNANGGINGRPVKYEIGDDQWNPEVAAQLAAKIVNDMGAVAMAGSSSFVECGANAELYKTAGIVSVAGVGVPRECFSASHYAPTNAGPRVSTVAAAEYAGDVLGAKSFVCIAPNIPNVGPWACDGVKTWAESKGLTSTEILVDPGSLDAASVILQAAGSSPDAIVLSLPKGLMLPVLTAAEEQGLNETTKFVSAASGYDLTVPETLGAAWDGKFYVNMEFNPLGSDAADNQNWLAVMDAYAPADAQRDTFSQAGYLAARVVTEAMLTLDPAEVTRENVTAALGKVKAFKSDILCADWYYGKDGTRQNANHATRMSVTESGVWKAVSECAASGDPELADILAYEAANGIGQ
ncbi:MAG: ABC transporter substrate-binding protein [Rhodobacteraceae bacterium]|nr:ABC transporter substrate-binding protein [Paracoccaceae bacterium]